MRLRTKLPVSVEEIAEVIGREKALEFIGSRPRAGSRAWRICFYIPKRVRPDHWLVDALGWEDAQRMAHAFSGMILQPSNCRFLARRLRQERVIEMAAEGVPEPLIAELMDLSEYWVRELVSGPPLKPVVMVQHC